MSRNEKNDLPESTGKPAEKHSDETEQERPLVNNVVFFDNDVMESDDSSVEPIPSRRQVMRQFALSGLVAGSVLIASPLLVGCGGCKRHVPDDHYGKPCQCHQRCRTHSATCGCNTDRSSNCRCNQVCNCNRVCKRNCP